MRNNTRSQILGGKTAKTKVLYKRRVDGRVISVEQLPAKTKHGFIGLNKEAAKALGIKSNIKSNEVITCKYRGLKKGAQRRTIQHEIIEAPMMRYFRKEEHLKPIDAYHKAHKVALRFEDTRTTPSEALRWYKQQKRK